MIIGVVSAKARCEKRELMARRHAHDDDGDDDAAHDERDDTDDAPTTAFAARRVRAAVQTETVWQHQRPTCVDESTQST